MSRLASWLGFLAVVSCGFTPADWDNSKRGPDRSDKCPGIMKTQRYCLYGSPTDYNIDWYCFDTCFNEVYRDVQDPNVACSIFTNNDDESDFKKAFTTGAVPPDHPVELPPLDAGVSSPLPAAFSSLSDSQRVYDRIYVRGGRTAYFYAKSGPNAGKLLLSFPGGGTSPFFEFPYQCTEGDCTYACD